MRVLGALLGSAAVVACAHTSTTSQEKAMEMQVKVEGAGPPLVLMGGGLTGWLGWEPHVKPLAGSRKVIRPQLLSVQAGLEGKPLPQDYSIKMESRALAATLEQQGLTGRIDLVAWSFGALVTLDYALDHPDRVRSLTLIEPPAIWLLKQLDRIEPGDRPFFEELKSYGGDISEAQLASWAKNAGLCPPGKQPSELPQWPVWLQHRQSLRNNLAVIQHVGDLEKLRAFTPPVLLFKGTGTTPFLERIVDILGQQLPHAQVVELPAGHAPHLVSQAAFLEKLAAFQQAAQAP